MTIAHRFHGHSEMESVHCGRRTISEVVLCARKMGGFDLRCWFLEGGCTNREHLER